MLNHNKNKVKSFQALPKDNQQLCQLAKSIIIPGPLDLTYQYDPNFFHSLSVQGKFNQVGACSVNDTITAFGCRSIKPMYINEQAKNFGYLGGLKSSSKHLGGNTARIFKLLSQEHHDNKAPAYINQIIDNSHYAKLALTTARKGMPLYTPYGKLITYAILINKKKKIKKNKNSFEIKKGDSVELKEIISFLNKEGKKKQFYPVYKEKDFNSDYTRDFNLKDLYVAIKNKKIIGVLGKWDQAKFKRLTIVKYNRFLKYFRAPINMILKIKGYKPLPHPPQQIKMFYLSFVCIAKNDLSVMQALFNEVYSDNKNLGYDCIIGSFHEKDPLQNSLADYFSIKYKSTIYIVTMGQEKDYTYKLKKNLIPYLEIGTL